MDPAPNGKIGGAGSAGILNASIPLMTAGLALYLRAPDGLTPWP